jgi:hypothetical protein
MMNVLFIEPPKAVWFVMGEYPARALAAFYKSNVQQSGGRILDPRGGWPGVY